MATTDDVSEALVDFVLAVLNANGNTIPLQVGVGWPFGSSMSEILGQNQAQITVFPLTSGAQNRTSRKPTWKDQTAAPTPSPLVATVNGDVIELSGSVVSGVNVHIFAGSPLNDFFYQTVATDTLLSLPATLAAVVNNAMYPGVTANGVKTGVQINGSATVQCNVGLSNGASMVREARRQMVPIQVSVWAANAADRKTLAKLILNNVGTATGEPGQVLSPMLQAPDGAAIWVRYRNENQIEVSQSAYSLYEYHIVYECEFPTLQTTTATPVESVGANYNGMPTIYTGG